ncbi:MAG TPA: isoprenyl transferase [Bacteroidales bacterium]|nr:isoprenyl transferase [Bacteroidales bacterium]
MTDFRSQIKNKGIPVHVAVIMDGNGRWAKQHGYARTRGHEQGVEAVRQTVEAAVELGIRYLTLYAFSTENWNRPKYEIHALMQLLVRSVNKERKTFMDNNIRLTAIGDLKSLPGKSYEELMDAIRETSGNTGMQLILALSYSSRWEITEAVRKLSVKVAKGALKPEQISAEIVSEELTTSSIPDPELLIRTSGEYRVSNFLLWQIAYTELYFTQALWPDFTKEEFYCAIVDYQKRERRFGLTSSQLRKNKPLTQLRG